MFSNSKHIKRFGFYGAISIIVVIMLMLHRCGGCNRDSHPGTNPIQSTVTNHIVPTVTTQTDSNKIEAPTTIIPAETVYINKKIYIHDTIEVLIPKTDTVLLYVPKENKKTPKVTGLFDIDEKHILPLTPPVRKNIDFGDTKSELPLPDKKYNFLLKLNLLALPLTLANVELEVPLSNRFSVSAEWLGAWWWKADQYRGLHFAGGAVEGRYWFKEQIRYKKLSGFFVGINAGGGIYDILYESKGYKGEYYTAGFTAGFAHSIGKRLSLEYSLGVGYITSTYEYFTSSTPNLNPWRYDAKFSLVGPTRARVALSWYF